MDLVQQHLGSSPGPQGLYFPHAVIWYNGSGQCYLCADCSCYTSEISCQPESRHQWGWLKWSPISVCFCMRIFVTHLREHRPVCARARRAHSPVWAETCICKPVCWASVHLFHYGDCNLKKRLDERMYCIKSIRGMNCFLYSVGSLSHWGLTLSGR